jgi:hypothetical protein
MASAIKGSLVTARVAAFPTTLMGTGAVGSARIVNLDTLAPSALCGALRARWAFCASATEPAFPVFMAMVSVCAAQRGEQYQIVRTATTAILGRVVRVCVLALHSPASLAMGMDIVFLVMQETVHVRATPALLGLAALLSAHSTASVMAHVSVASTTRRYVNATNTGLHHTVNRA